MHFSNVSGKHGANWSMLLNVIYMVVPLWITKKVLDKPSNLKVNLSFNYSAFFMIQQLIFLFNNH